MSRTSSKFSRAQVIEQLWEQACLDYLLHEPQRQIKAGILSDSNKISIVLCSRRLGKTFLMCTMAIEACLAKSNAVVKYAFPKANMAKKMIHPVMRQILEDCPRHLKPEYVSSEKLYRFPNGSEMQLSGTDAGGFDNLRGGNSDLNVIDESGYCDDLTYGVRSVMAPSARLTGGRTIMVSTPSKKLDHEFIQNWVNPYMAEGRVKVFTIFDNPQLNEKSIKEAMDEYPDGDRDPMFRREYLCEITRGTDNTILPSLTSEIEKAIVRDDYVRPIYYTPYVSVDIGGTDLTFFTFGYHDYLSATLVIEDEIVADGTVNTAILADMVREKERQLWSNPIDRSPIPPYLRIADNNNIIFVNDLQRLHGLMFVRTKKDNLEAAINALDMDIMQQKIIIHPRCKTLLYHMKFAEWNKNRTKFKQMKDSSDTKDKIRGGHADGLAALIYMHRNIIRTYNPYPANYGSTTGPNAFHSPNTQHNTPVVGNSNVSSELVNQLKTMMGLGKKKSP